MSRPAVILNVLLATLITIGTACDGAGPFATENTPAPDQPDPTPALPDAITPSAGAAHGSFLGFVEAVDPVKGTVTLTGNVKVQLTTQSLLHGGDFATLAQVQAALQAGIPVLCDADGFLNAGILIVIKIRFDKNRSCSSCDEDPGGNGSGGNGSGGTDPRRLTLAEFGGHVHKVDPTEKSIMIAGGLKIMIDGETKVEFEDECGCKTLDDVKSKMNAGFTINARIRGAVVHGMVPSPKTLKFQVVHDPTGGKNDEDQGEDPNGDDEGDDDDDEKADASGTILSVDLTARVVTLVGGKKLKIASDAFIEVGSDFRTLAEVDAAVKAGVKIRVHARGVLNLFGLLEVTKCRFEREDDPPGNGEEDDPSLVEIKGVVASVNLLDGTCRTTDGHVIKIVSGTLIDAAGDLFSLADVALRVTLGLRVRVEALGTLSANGLIATKVKFMTG